MSTNYSMEKFSCGFGSSACDQQFQDVKKRKRSAVQRPVLRQQMDRDVNLQKIRKIEDSPCMRALPFGTQSDYFFTDSLTGNQIREHLESLPPLTNMDVNSSGKRCHLCSMGELKLKPPPTFCFTCGKLFKGSKTWRWTKDENGTKYCFCTVCLNKVPRDGKIICGAFSLSKKDLERNMEMLQGPNEEWVRCEKCYNLQHITCGLYNSERDEEKKAKYMCPKCRLKELETEDCVFIKGSIFGARQLPRTALSDHIEKRLRISLELERNQRAKALETSLEEVPEAKDLVVRVVSSVNKELKVKHEFSQILPTGNTYPSELPYTSKVILLFQEVAGVEVLLFVMYVQEFGSECGSPNNRSIYISYLDSVRYFTPGVKTVAGDSLRTFVYHEILIGYLDYCKKRGFTTCYIWSCPPEKGDNYILHCHPITQGTPSSEKLRKWYVSMLHRAKEENIVTGYTNFYEKFMDPKKVSSDKITAANLPYFDGAYWLDFIESELKKMETTKCYDLPTKLKHKMANNENSSKALLVMHELSKIMKNKKNDFLVIDLHFTCTKCNETILSGRRWSCEQCSYFHLCDRCCAVQLSAECGEKHILTEIRVDCDIKDVDGTIDSKLFENRCAILDYCQKHNYQFDLLSRAKHTSLMILYILHESINLMRPIQYSCYQKDTADCITRKKKQQQILKEKKMVEILTHANSCPATRDKPCSYPKCIDVKEVFLHSRDCETRAAGGCEKCKKIWYLINLHFQHCTDHNCNFPRCMDMKNRTERSELKVKR